MKRCAFPAFAAVMPAPCAVVAGALPPCMHGPCRRTGLHGADDALAAAARRIFAERIG